MPKIIGFMALHYGADYLRAAIRSVLPYIDEMHIAYSATPSHGFQSGLPCPDTKAQLYALAKSQAGGKLRWHDNDGSWRHEGQQRDSIYTLAPDADIIIVVDSDEIYPQPMIERIIELSLTVTNSIPPARYIRLPFIHFYRHFQHCILHDPAYPIRIIYPRISATYGETTWNPDYVRGYVNHLGYCQRPDIIRYKLSIHGHSNQLRMTPDEYMDTIYLDQDRWTDLHPVGSDYWNAEPVNPFDYLPDWMRNHPYANVNSEVIP